MSTEPTNDKDGDSDQDAMESGAGSVSRKPLRIWPVLLLLLGMVVSRSLPGLMEDGPPTIWMLAAFGPLSCGALVVIWWLAASRATWQERVVGFVGIVAALIITLVLIDPSMRGPAVMIVTVPMGTAAFALGAVLCSQMRTFRRTAIAVLMAIAGFGFSTLLRSDGMWGDFALGLHWRWVASPEEQMLAAKGNAAAIPLDFATSTDVDQALANPEWPAFRGTDRRSRQSGMKFALDWDNNRPQEQWKIAV